MFGTELEGVGVVFLHRISLSPMSSSVTCGPRVESARHDVSCSRNYRQIAFLKDSIEAGILLGQILHVRRTFCIRIRVGYSPSPPPFRAFFVCIE